MQEKLGAGIKAETLQKARPFKFEKIFQKIAVEIFGGLFFWQEKKSPCRIFVKTAKETKKN